MCFCALIYEPSPRIKMKIFWQSMPRELPRGSRLRRMIHYALYCVAKTETPDLALGSIFLKHKTNKLKPATLLQRKVSWSVEQILGFYDAFLYTKYRLKDGKSQEKSSRETMLTNISELWQNESRKKGNFNNSGVKREFVFFAFFFCIRNPTPHRLCTQNVTIFEKFDPWTC